MSQKHNNITARNQKMASGNAARNENPLRANDNAQPEAVKSFRSVRGIAISNKSGKRIINTILVLLLLIVFSSLSSATTVFVENKFAKIGETFTINVTCYPTQPIKSYECVLYFNSSILRCNKIENGNFFLGYSTFISPQHGIINNTTGMVKDIYELIVGQGNVTTNGILFVINFTAIANGTCFVNLSNMGLTNETQYVNKTITNGCVFILNSEENESNNTEPPENNTRPPEDNETIPDNGTTLPENNTIPVNPPVETKTDSTIVYILVAVGAVIVVLTLSSRRKTRW